MSQVSLANNPFALMMHPEDVLQAVERSNHLGGLQRRICRPLDRPAIAVKKEAAGEFADDFFRAVEQKVEQEN